MISALLAVIVPPNLRTGSRLIPACHAVIEPAISAGPHSYERLSLRASPTSRRPQGSAAPLEGARLDRVLECSALGAGAAIFALQSIVPLRLGIGVIDQRHRRIVAQALLLALHDVAVLAQKGAHVMTQNRLEHPEPG